MVKNKRIMVVDDERSAMHLISHHLISMGFSKILFAEDAAAALEILKAQPIDLIIADWHMPGPDGLEFFKTLRSDKTFQSIPFLMITAESQKERVMEAMQAGIRDYIIKPVYADTLKQKIYKLLKVRNGSAPAAPPRS